MYWDWYYKKKSTTHMNLVLNLKSSPLLKPHSLSSIVSFDGSIPGILFLRGGGHNNERPQNCKQLTCHILLNFLIVLYHSSGIFEEEKVARGKIWKIWWWLNLGNVVFSVKIASQVMFTDGISLWCGEMTTLYTHYFKALL